MRPEEISEGLRIALSRGESLQNAMQSFYNAGYNREDVESAARMVNQSNVTTVQTQPIVKVISNTIQPQPQNIQAGSQAVNRNQVSNYGNENPKDPRKTMITLVIIMLVIFGIILGALFLFKAQIVGFLENLVS